MTSLPPADEPSDAAQTRARRPLNLPPPTKSSPSSPQPESGEVGAEDGGAVPATTAEKLEAAQQQLLGQATTTTAPPLSSEEKKIRLAKKVSRNLLAGACDPQDDDEESAAVPLTPLYMLRPLRDWSVIAMSLRAHLSAPLPASDQLRRCDADSLQRMRTEPAEVMRVAHEKIHVFPYKNVEKCWLRAWVEASLWRVLQLLEKKGAAEQDDWVTELVRVLDMALILAGGVGREDACEWVFRALEELLENEQESATQLPGRMNTQPSKALAENQEGLNESAEQGGRSQKRRKLSGDINSKKKEDDPGSRFPDSFPSSGLCAPPLRSPIPRYDKLSLEAFQDHLEAADPSKQPIPGQKPENLPTPIIITGALNHWPAMSDPSRQWSNPNYLMRKTIGGRRLVPVEIGKSYTDDDWGQGIITFKEFMEKYMFANTGENDGASASAAKQDMQGHAGTEESDHNASDQINQPDDYKTTTAADDDDDEDDTETTSSHPPRRTGYLAQHDLFHQIPSLRSDIAIPDHCYTTPVPSTPPPTADPLNLPLYPGHDLFPLLNAWFGPADTVSPAHTDPYHNILAQVVGYKYLRLYPRDAGTRAAMHPRGVDDALGVDMGNTSAVDVGEAMDVLEGWGEGEWLRGRAREGEEGDDGMTRAERWAREEDRKMRLFDFEERFPAFVERWRSEGDGGFVEAVLGPGECLFIPKGWWHYVRSLSPSFSVSFWWD